MAKELKHCTDAELEEELGRTTDAAVAANIRYEQNLRKVWRKAEVRTGFPYNPEWH